MIHSSVCYQASILPTKMKFPRPPCRKFIFCDLHCTEIEVITKDPEIIAQLEETGVQWEKCFIFFLESPWAENSSWHRHNLCDTRRNWSHSWSILPSDLSLCFSPLYSALVSDALEWIGIISMFLKWRHPVGSLFASDPVLPTSRSLVGLHWFTTVLCKPELLCSVKAC